MSLSMYLKIGVVERRKDGDFQLLNHPSCDFDNLSKAWPNPRAKSGASPESHMWMTEAQTLRPSSAAFPKPPAGNWIGCGTAKTWNWYPCETATQKTVALSAILDAGPMVSILQSNWLSFNYFKGRFDYFKGLIIKIGR